MAKIGDIVRFLNSVGGGRITRIDGKMAYVDDDGFETPVLLKECVVVSEAPSVAKPAPVVTEEGRPKTTPAPQPPVYDNRDEHIVVEETPEGEKLNVQLVYEPTDIKRLSTSQFETFIVNDSNYTLFVSYLTRGKDEEKSRARFIGTVDAGVVLYLDTLTRDDLPDIDRVTVQLIAYKPDKAFAAKIPVSVDQRLDVTKFAKLHCFTPNPYFDGNVITLEIVTDDVPYRQVRVDAKDLEKGMAQKAASDMRHPAARKAVKKAQGKGELVVDLHIHELVDDMRGLTNADMLNIQIDHFRKVMDENRRNHGKKIIFIHGKGEGVLRHALLKELNYRYKGCDVQDASFREYGFGATQVTVK